MYSNYFWNDSCKYSLILLSLYNIMYILYHDLYEMLYDLYLICVLYCSGVISIEGSTEAHLE